MRSMGVLQGWYFPRESPVSIYFNDKILDWKTKKTKHCLSMHKDDATPACFKLTSGLKCWNITCWYLENYMLDLNPTVSPKCWQLIPLLHIKNDDPQTLALKHTGVKPVHTLGISNMCNLMASWKNIIALSLSLLLLSTPAKYSQTIQSDYMCNIPYLCKIWPLTFMLTHFLLTHNVSSKNPGFIHGKAEDACDIEWVFKDKTELETFCKFIEQFMTTNELQRL